MQRLWTTFRYTYSWFRGQILGWGLGIAALGLLIVAFYGVFFERQADFMKMVEAYPPEFLAFFGTSAQGLLTPGGYLGIREPAPRAVPRYAPAGGLVHPRGGLPRAGPLAGPHPGGGAQPLVPGGPHRRGEGEAAADRGRATQGHGPQADDVRQ